MRQLLVLPILLVASVASADPKALESKEVRDRLKAIDTEIASCYLGTVGDRAGAGHLDITLDIHRTGVVDKITVATPNLPAKLATKIDACVRAAVKGIDFPVRRAGTVATVPYFYQRTAAPNAGPQESCWSASGCREDGTPKSDPTAKSNTPKSSKVSARVQARRGRI